ncbi:MAG TPA: transposase [Candidatus Didemnitutus sp.]|nr:transposase [Candidatus Didemnitutus sp.]
MRWGAALPQQGHTVFEVDSRLVGSRRGSQISSMREARIKIDPKCAEAVYHCVSKAVAAEWLFDDVSKEVFRRQLWRAADYCGVQVITHALLSNHFHVVIRVPVLALVPDSELLRRYALYRDLSKNDDRARMTTLRAQLAANGPKADHWRRQQLAQMGDISSFMKKWKQRFSQWFNRNHRRIGTLWASRFTSILVQPTGFATETVSAYADLNPVRAGIVTDPKDYRFCGYAEAVSGQARARAGIGSLYPSLRWREVQERYRLALFAIGADVRKGKASIPLKDYKRVREEKGRLEPSELLLHRIRHFVHGGVLGSRAFVEEQLAAFERRTRERPRTRPRTLGFGDQELYVMRNVRDRAA